MVLWYYTLDYTGSQFRSVDWKVRRAVLTPSVEARDGVATVAVSASDMEKSIEDVKKSGGDLVTIIPEVSGKATKTIVEIPKTSLSELASGTKAGIKVETVSGSVTIPNEALSRLVSEASGKTVAVVVESVDTRALTPEQQKAVGDKPVFDISILSGDQAIGSFGGKSITVSLPIH